MRARTPVSAVAGSAVLRPGRAADTVLPPLAGDADPGRRTAQASSGPEAELLLRVLSALLREDVVGLRSRTTPVRRPDGRWLRLAVGARDERGAGGAADIRSPERNEAPTGTAAEAGTGAATGARPGASTGAREGVLTEAPTGVSVRGQAGASAEAPVGASAEAREGVSAEAPTRTSARARHTAVGRTEGEVEGDDALLLPVTDDGFQSESAARLPLLVRESTGEQLATLDAVLTALGELADPADRPGFAAFAEECRQTLATMRLHAEVRDEVAGRLTDRHGADPADWTGPGGALAHDTLAAYLDHPVYPTARGRSGLGEDELRAYAPEFHPQFALRWIVLPKQAVTVHNPHTGPAFGPDGTPAPVGRAGSPDTAPRRTAAPDVVRPSPALLGLPELEGTHLALPVHPLTVGPPLREALRATGLQDRAVLAERPFLEAVPTLSMRTVALADDPALHLKLPLATASLGLRNRRTIKPGTLVDGAAGQRLLETVIAREPRFRDTVLHADESRFAHAGHELLAVLCRRYPAGLDNALVVPMAALLSRAPGSRLMIDHLADRWFGGDPTALLDACLTLLFDWQTTLFRYGIALESHQQNISLVLDHDDRDAGRARIRLLLKDNDGPRINTVRLRETLGDLAPDPSEFADPRIFGDSDGPVTDLFTTITVHLCAGAYAFGLARHGRAPLDRLLRLVRDRLAEAVERIGTGPGEPGAVLRQRVLDATWLPIKAMVTAGTLLTKERSGAADINKHYSTGPNYLLTERGWA